MSDVTPQKPRKPKAYPSTVLQAELHKAGADAKLMWEIPGPKNTMTAWLSCYLVRGIPCIVQTFADGGWDAYTPSLSISIDATVADVLARTKQQAAA